MQQFAFLVREGNFSEEFVLSLPAPTRKALVGITLKQTRSKDQFDMDEFIDRESYFRDDKDREEYHNIVQYRNKWKQKMREAQAKKSEAKLSEFKKRMEQLGK